MLVGVTGSDFMNMVFMSADSLVLELNPVFYATDVFRTMADVLGLQYLAWTCTAPTCAFDEDRRQWGKMVAALGVTVGKRRDIQRIGARSRSRNSRGRRWATRCAPALSVRR
jgi:hypothetical protein